MIHMKYDKLLIAILFIAVFITGHQMGIHQDKKQFIQQLEDEQDKFLNTLTQSHQMVRRICLADFKHKRYDSCTKALDIMAKPYIDDTDK